MTIEEQFEHLILCSVWDLNGSKDLIEAFRAKLSTTVRIIDEEFGDSNEVIERKHKCWNGE